MFKYLLFLFLLGFCITTKAQYLDDSFDINDYKHTINLADHKIVFQAKPTKIPKSLHPQKKYYWYASNQIQTTQGGYSGKLLNGNYSAFYLNNNLKEKGVFKGGLKEGEWNNWSEGGVLIETNHYKNGILNGQFFTYDQTGKLFREGNYRDGKIDGVFKTHQGPDSLTLVKYQDGVVKPASKSWFKKILHKKRK